MGLTPFMVHSDELGQRLSALSGEQAGRFFVAAGQVLRPAYEQWCADEGITGDADLLDEIVEWVATPAGQRDAEIGRRLKVRSEAIPEDPESERDWSTEAMDCLICMDLGLGALLGQQVKVSYAWYLFEPTMVSVSVRLFGVMPGSGGDDGEELVLEDPQFRQVDDALAMAIDSLIASDPSFDALVRDLAPVLPPEFRRSSPTL
ncbi:hypothetical protein I6B53_08200 [Schaalia sp. 19OD2882]|uniref:hypothetical protein n=1 Tax=Schaalia sp. 19OD2882 TaxID=2794089 RepID=UPI001C1ECC83|nr:hypothetical protein [Schaalia sp. 19OD2882]QWW19095.1 hypothetical protein I6B53_08200 [Schaalia sp. 19OD2882]